MNDIQISVQLVDALKVDVNALVLKHAQYLFGLDRKIIQELNTINKDIQKYLPKPGQVYITKSNGVTVAENLLFIGTPELDLFSYKDVRDFSRNALIGIKENIPNVKKIAMTMHGVNFGLDEAESFKSLIAGVVDAVKSNGYPGKLEEIIIAEISERRVKMANEILSNLLPNGLIPKYLINLKEESNEILRSAGYNSDRKKNIFVAMPFAAEFDDVYHYAIQGSVKAAGCLCERADFSSFTGNIMKWVKDRIESAELVIADLSSSSANVYLEVGYAWGVGKPTILLTQNVDELKFDVRDQRCIEYSKIHELEKKLTNELIELIK